MEDVNEMLAEQQRELERIRGRRHRVGNMERTRKLLNIIFLVLALIGIVIYFGKSDSRLVGLIVIACGMVVKIAEFFIRFMF